MMERAPKDDIIQALANESDRKVKMLLLLERDHCKKAHRAEMEHRHLPGGYTR